MHHTKGATVNALEPPIDLKQLINNPPRLEYEAHMVKALMHELSPPGMVPSTKTHTHVYTRYYQH